MYEAAGQFIFKDTFKHLRPICHDQIRALLGQTDIFRVSDPFLGVHLLLLSRASPETTLLMSSLCFLRSAYGGWSLTRWTDELLGKAPLKCALKIK